jgi:hypothetical protein
LEGEGELEVEGELVGVGVMAGDPIDAH